MDLTATKAALVELANFILFVYVLITIVWEKIGPGVEPLARSAFTAFSRWTK